MTYGEAFTLVGIFGGVAFVGFVLIYGLLSFYFWVRDHFDKKRFHANWAKKEFKELQGILKAKGLPYQERITRKGK